MHLILQLIYNQGNLKQFQNQEMFSVFSRISILVKFETYCFFSISVVKIFSPWQVYESDHGRCSTRHSNALPASSRGHAFSLLTGLIAITKNDLFWSLEPQWPDFVGNHVKFESISIAWFEQLIWNMQKCASLENTLFDKHFVDAFGIINIKTSKRH